MGLATVIALLKTQGVMMQFSYASIGPRSARKLGGQFMNGVTFVASRGKSVFTTGSDNGSKDKQKKDNGQGDSTAGSKRHVPTGTTYIAPQSKSAAKGTPSNTGERGLASTKKRQPQTAAVPSPQKEDANTPFDPTNVNNNRRSKL